MKMFRVSKEIVSVLLKKKTPFLQTPNKAFVNFAMQVHKTPEFSLKFYLFIEILHNQ